MCCASELGLVVVLGVWTHACVRARVCNVRGRPSTARTSRLAKAAGRAALMAGRGLQLGWGPCPLGTLLRPAGALHCAADQAAACRLPTAPSITLPGSPPHAQDLVYGDATSKEVINFLSLNQALPAADKVCPRGVGVQMAEQRVAGDGKAEQAARLRT